MSITDLDSLNANMVEAALGYEAMQRLEGWAEKHASRILKETRPTYLYYFTSTDVNPITGSCCVEWTMYEDYQDDYVHRGTLVFQTEKLLLTDEEVRLHYARLREEEKAAAEAARQAKIAEAKATTEALERKELIRLMKKFGPSAAKGVEDLT